MKKTPLAVLIADVHFSLKTIDVAAKAMNMAIDKANELLVPVIVAGDLHDTKANIRGECIKAIREVFERAAVIKERFGDNNIKPFVIVGNHCRINEKSPEHSLEFMHDLVTVVNTPGFFNDLGAANGNSIWMFPYFSNTDDFKKALDKVDKGSLIIMHQGVFNSKGEEWKHDNSAIPSDWLDGYRVVSGHYHERQTISCGRTGVFDYIGNPYTLGFGEHAHPPKGFQVLYRDGSLEFIPTNLRKHVVHDIDADFSTLQSAARPQVNRDDRLLVKVTGTKEQLIKITKKYVASYAGLDEDFEFRLDLIPKESTTSAPATSRSLSKDDLLDSLIDSLSAASTEQKERVKTLWKELREKN